MMVERSRAFGRLLCEGVILYAQEQHWTIRYMTPDRLKADQTADLDGFIARVTTPEMARALVRTRKPVVDVFYSHPDFGFAIVKEKHESLGRIAAEHFLDRKFVNFAYCPYGIGKTSAYCQAAYVHRLRREGHNCHVFANASEIAYEPDNRTIIGERLVRPNDARALAKWLKCLPKPVGIFCPDDIRAWQVLDCCLANKIDVPNDIAILGLDNDILICGGTQPMLSSIDPNAREIGKVAAETLHQMMDRKNSSRQIVRQIEPLGVITRASTEIYPLDPPWLSEALVFINRSIPNGISALDVVNHLGRSHTLMAKTFKAKLGKTIQQVIAQARLELARKYLAETTLSITEIASRCGFRTPTYFLQAFSAAHHISPGAWREKHSSL